ELWYRVDWESRYSELFEYISAHDIAAGLHFWGLLDGGLQPNIAYPDEKIWKPTVALMRQNIDVAAKHRTNYVNIHVGNNAIDAMNLDEHWLRTIPDSIVEMARSEETAEKNIVELDAYAKNLGVRLIVETIPSHEAEHWDDDTGRLHPHDGHALSNQFLERLGREHGILINNDISHTSSELVTDDRDALWKYLLERTTALAPTTALVHCNTLLPPFNGTDSHNGILDDDFAQNVLPSREQLRELLHVLAAAEHDIWIINEPKQKHIENYRALCDLLASL
ncbi:MAG TPA: hypothetical protein VFG51_02995, partial [Candidatus Saccharimonadia bacterium]|nr:hypothetical protein [Candidatus Saccharimonadia bacterium]